MRSAFAVLVTLSIWVYFAIMSVHYLAYYTAAYQINKWADMKY